MIPLHSSRWSYAPLSNRFSLRSVGEYCCVPTVSLAVPLLLLLFIHLGFSPRPLQAQEPTQTMTLEEYVAELRTARQQLQTTPTAATVRSVRARLTQIQSVTAGEGNPIVLAPLLGTAADPVPTVDEATARLTVVIDQVSAVNGDSTAAQLALLSSIYEQAAFIQRESLWQRFWRWLRNWLPDLSANEGTAPNDWMTFGSYLLGYLIIGIAIILLIYLLSIWLQNLLGGFLGGANRGRRLTPDGELLNAAEAKEQADQLARSGSFREALRRLYLSALLTLDERNLLHYDRSNTNREVLATVRNNPALYQQLQPVVETFDDVWYGIHEPDQATFDQYKEAVEALEGETT